MDKPSLPTLQKMRVTFWLGVSTWLFAFLTLGVYIWSSKSMRWPPDFRIMLVTFALMILLAVITAGFGIFHFFRGPRRVAALAAILFGALPAVAIGCFFAELYWRATNRKAIDRNMAVESIAYLASDIADFEATLRGLRRVVGPKCTLIDDGQLAETDALMAEMNQHIDSMCSVLGVQHTKQAYWVRHPLLGDRGRSIIGWAVCDHRPAESAATLDYLDKHEMAHAVISLACPPTANPPSVLVEGWAETQSNDTLTSCNALVENRKNDPNFPTLAEIISPTWYTRSFGPVYPLGGAFVSFLIEKHGGPAFFKLYSETSPESFEQDFQNVYRQSWASVESDFEAWLATKVPSQSDEAAKANDLVTLESRIKLASGVNETDWQTLWNAAKEAHAIRSNSEGNAIGLRVGHESQKATEKSEDGFHADIRVFMSDKEAMFVQEDRYGSEALFANAQMGMRGGRSSKDNRRSGCLVQSRSERESIRDSVKAHRDHMLLAGDLVYLLGRSIPTATITIESLTEDFGTRTWDIVASLQAGEETSNLKLKVDPQVGWQCTSYRSTSQDKATDIRFQFVQHKNDWLLNQQKIEYTENDVLEWTSSNAIKLLSDREIVSLRDELLSIPIKPCENGQEVPIWLVLVRYGLASWAGLGSMLALSVKLFRI